MSGRDVSMAMGFCMVLLSGFLGGVGRAIDGFWIEWGF